MIAAKPRVVCLSSRLLTDRMILNSGFLPRLAGRARATVWTTAYDNPAFAAAGNAECEPFPHVREMRYRYIVLRRIAEYAWDQRGLSASRASFWRLQRRSELSARHRVFRLLGAGIAALRMQRPFERLVEPILRSDRRSVEALARLKEASPAAVLATSPFRRDEPGVVAAAKRLKIPVIGLITSWDNITTKGRLMFGYDGYLVWSEQMRNELHRFYPDSRNVPVHITGAPQFDVFFQERYRQSREEFCAGEGLDPTRPIILYGLGSPQLIVEHPGAFELARRMRDGALGDAQLVVRPHPVFLTADGLSELTRILPGVVIQWPDRSGADLGTRFQGHARIREWVNTFRHADVVVNLSSTIAVDAAVAGTPVVNLDYDPAPSGAQAALIHDINHVWNHFRPIAESGGVRLVKSHDEMVDAIRAYLADPDLHREQRRWIAGYVCGPLDGRAGERMADGVLGVIGGGVKA